MLIDWNYDIVKWNVLDVRMGKGWRAFHRRPLVFDDHVRISMGAAGKGERNYRFHTYMSRSGSPYLYKSVLALLYRTSHLFYYTNVLGIPLHITFV